MVVVCPSCSSKYSVQADAIGNGKLVRCAMCGATWQQNPVAEKSGSDISSFFKIATFWFTVFITIFSIFFAPQTVVKYWPAISSFYELIGYEGGTKTELFSVKNISSFFVKKDGKLYMGIKGEICNVSNDVQMSPDLIISLKSDDEGFSYFKSSWIHRVTYEKILPNQTIVFETGLTNVPYTNLICEIRLNTF